MFKAAIFSILYCFPFLLTAQTAKEIVEKTEDKMRGKTSQAIIVVKTIRPSWTREMRLKTWMKGNDYSTILITSPVRDKGIVFLKRKKEVWNWMPSIEKIIKLPPSMMSQSWMGTDFTNDDLVKESSLVTDYNHAFTNDTTINSRSCFQIIMIPKPEAAVVWGKLITCIDKEKMVQLHARFYDESNELINTMNAFEVKMMDGRLIPTRFEMIPANKKNQKTEMRYVSVIFNRTIDESLFTTDKMRYITEIQ
jgi:outer membrane lipoprotein-sorting protein